jgi:hypothetical protein
VSNDDERLQTESLEIEQLLDEIQALVPAPAWQRVERVVGRVIRLYGAGLARALDHARAAGVEGARLDERVAEDDLLASLLLLHGLHPLDVVERVRRAVELARTELGLAEADLEVTSVRDGQVEIRTAQTLGGGAMAARVAEGAIRRAIETAAPEVTHVEIHGPGPARDPGLVQLRVRREGA